MEIELEEKFIVLNLKHLNNQDNSIKRELSNILSKLKMPDNKYYVCNQDEPYAQEVINIILKGEKEKCSSQTSNSK